MTHEKNNFGGRAEHPGSDEQKISSMLSGLKRVEAPKDFDFHLKARIAKGKPADMRSGSFFPILKYGVPLALFLVVGAGVMLNNSFNSGVDPNAVSQPPVSEPSPSASSSTDPVLAQDPVPATGPSNPLVAGSGSSVLPERENTPTRKEVRDSRPDVERPSGGSKTLTGGNSADPRIPKGFSLPNSNTEKIANLDSTSKNDNVGDALRPMGVEVELEGNIWSVRNVAAGSIGSGMGIKAGDRVEAIDGKPVDRNTTYKGQFRARSISVRRDGSVIDLKPQN